MKLFRSALHARTFKSTQVKSSRFDLNCLPRIDFKVRLTASFVLRHTDATDCNRTAYLHARHIHDSTACDSPVTSVHRTAARPRPTLQTLCMDH